MEVPIDFDQKVSGIRISKNANLSQEDKKLMFEHSFTRLAIYKSKKTGKIKHLLLNYVPSIAYLRKHNFKIQHNHVTQLDADFSGYIEYKKWDGTPTHIVMFNNGKRTKAYKVGSSKQAFAGKTSQGKNATVMVEICDTYYDEIWRRECVVVGTYERCEVLLVGIDETTYCFDDGLTGDPCIDFGDCTEEEMCLIYGDCPPEDDNSETADIKDNLDNYPCAKKLVGQLTSLKTDISNLIKNSFAKNDKTNVVFEADNTLSGSSVGGKLKNASGYGNNYTYYIGLNPDILNNATKEYILVTMYHEAIHAYLSEKKRVLGDVEFNNQFGGLTVNGGRLIGVQDPQHWPMGYANFINGMRDAILAFNPAFSSDRAYSLAAGGVMTLTPAQSTVNSQERDTTVPGYQGSKCP